MTVTLAKQAIDLGVMTNHWDDYREAAERLGLVGHELLKVGNGVHQHRYNCGDSILKINSHRDRLEALPSALRLIRVVADTDSPVTFRSPDGFEIEAVPAGHDGILSNEVSWHASSPGTIAEFLERSFGATTTADIVTIGTSRIRLVAEPTMKAMPDRPFAGAGIRYLTVQIYDVVAEHQRILDLGAAEGSAPRRLGDTAAISFVLAPDGTWIELSQRASLTGSIANVQIP